MAKKPSQAPWIKPGTGKKPAPKPATKGGKKPAKGMC